MMIKYRVSNVAKDFDIPGKRIIALLDEKMGKQVKSMTALEEDELDLIFETLTQETALENFDAYFALQNEKPAKKAPAAAPAAENQPAAAPVPAEAAPAPAAKADGKPAASAAPAAKAPAAQPQPQNRPAKADKPKNPVQPKAPVERRTVELRTQNNVGNKYDEKFDVLAQTSNRVRGDGGAVQKQKLNQRSKQNRRPQRRRETEAERLKRIQQERKAKHMTITVGDTITVGELASRMKATAAEVIKKLFMLGVMATVNQEIDFDTAYLVAEEFHVKVEHEVVVTIEERIIDDSTEYRREPAAARSRRGGHGSRRPRQDLYP